MRKRYDKRSPKAAVVKKGIAARNEAATRQADNEPIVYSDEYRQFVGSILREKRDRELRATDNG